jgi:farnesyl diphosphate synthase
MHYEYLAAKSRQIPHHPAMPFIKELERLAKLVDCRLGHLLSVGQADDPTRLAESMRYAVLGPGKRLRPFLLISTARIFGVAEEAALDAAAALECVHCYSLVHDDLPAMDDDAMRRGRPTVHVAFGQATAILAGDGLLTLAFEIMSGEAVDPDPAVRVELVRLLAKAVGWQGMVLGQALDLAAEKQSLSAAEVARLQALKTGALFGFACDAGAILGRADAASRAAIATYTRAFGQAYQLADDLLDAEGDAAVLGKAAAKDAARGKATLIALLGVPAAKGRLAELVQEADAALAPFGEKASMLKELARFIATRRS